MSRYALAHSFDKHRFIGHVAHYAPSSTYASEPFRSAR